MDDTNKKDAVLGLYRTTVRNMLASKKPGMVPNASFQHASIIIEELARCAELRFFAFCEKLSQDVWTREVLDQLQIAIRRNVDVQIVLTSKPDIEPPAFLNDRIRILSLESLGDKARKLEAVGHFAVVDGKSLRLELDNTTRKALFAANQPKLAHELDAIFSFLREWAALAA